MKCKHNISERMAVGVALDQYCHGLYGVICLRCGELLSSGFINKKIAKESEEKRK